MHTLVPEQTMWRKGHFSSGYYSSKVVSRERLDIYPTVLFYSAVCIQLMESGDDVD